MNKPAVIALRTFRNFVVFICLFGVTIGVSIGSTVLLDRISKWLLPTLLLLVVTVGCFAFAWAQTNELEK